MKQEGQEYWKSLSTISIRPNDASNGNCSNISPGVDLNEESRSVSIANVPFRKGYSDVMAYDDRLTPVIVPRTPLNASPSVGEVNRSTPRAFGKR